MRHVRSPNSIKKKKQSISGLREERENLDFINTQSAKPRRDIKRSQNTFHFKMPIIFFFILNAYTLFLLFLVWIITSWAFRSDSTAARPPKHLANLAILSSNNLKAWESTGTSSFHASDLFKNRYKALLTSHNRNNIVPAIKPWDGKITEILPIFKFHGKKQSNVNKILVMLLSLEKL